MVSTGRHHGHESHEEKLLLLAADFASDLIEALAQPFRLQFWAMGSRVNHTPDFLLLRDRDSPLVIDVRPRHRIQRADAVKFAATAEAALAVGWDYAVVTGWRPHVVSIVDCLSVGRRPLSDPLSLQEQLIDTLAAGPCVFSELVDQCDVHLLQRYGENGRLRHAVHDAISIAEHTHPEKPLLVAAAREAREELGRRHPDVCKLIRNLLEPHLTRYGRLRLRSAQDRQQVRGEVMLALLELDRTAAPPRQLRH